MDFIKFESVLRLLRYYGINSQSIKSSFNILFGSQKYIKVKLKTYPHLIKIRRKSSDFAVFDEVLLRFGYRFKTNISYTPRAIIDCGGNIGMSSIFFNSLYPSAQIIAIEPEESNFKLMQENLSSYTNIHCLNSGIWSKDTYISVNDSNSTNYGFSFHESDSQVCDSVKAYSIESVMRKYNIDSIDILKIDIESAEKKVFESDCDYWLSRTRMLIVELHDRMQDGCSEAFFRALVKYKFTTEIRGENIFCFMKQ